MCATCPHAIRGQGLTVEGAAIACGAVDPPTDIVHHILGDEPCPDRRHPDGDGALEWAGLEWYGVPFPIRVWLKRTHPKHPEGFAGCGCIRPLKDIYSAMKAALARAIRHAQRHQRTQADAAGHPGP
jgi:hypothetical protein